MSANPYRGKHITANLHPPISPNVETRRRRPRPAKPPSVIARCNFSGNPSGHVTTVPTLYFTPSRFSTNQWTSFFSANEGWPMLLIVTWIPSTLTLNAELQANYGGGLLQIDTSFDAAYTGQEPFDSGPLAWHSWTGSVEIWTQGLWTP